MNLGYILFVVFGFLAVVLLLEGLYLLWTDTRSPEVKRIQRRLHTFDGGGRPEGGGPLYRPRLLSATPALDQALRQIPRAQLADQLLLQAGSVRSVAQLLGSCLLFGLAGFLLPVALLNWPWWWGLPLAAGLSLLPVLRLLWLRSQRIYQIGTQLPDVLDLISRALRAGHAFSAALSMVGDEAQDPIATEFRTTFDEINFGISTQDALVHLAQRVPLADMRYFVVAVVIQLETGGNLAELLSSLANLIRERFKLFGKIRVLAAEGKLSAYILIALPFCVAGVVKIVNPDYLNILFTDPAGIKLVITALIMMIVGSFVMWRIIKIRV